MLPDTNEPPQARPATSNARSDQLDSWKEIAAYLGRGVTTVQRWEQQEGLPVHRLPHTKKGSVFALQSELDSWLRGRMQLGTARPKSVSDEPVGDQLPSAVEARLTRTRPVLVYALLVLLAAALPVTRALRGSSPDPVGPAAPAVPRPLANDAGNESCATLSPDGTEVAYHWQRERESGIYVRRVAGGVARRLTTAPAGELFACGFAKWSPAGDLIAFLTVAKDGSSRDAWVVAPSGDRLRRLTSVSGVGLCWAPDARSLGFVDRNSPGEPFSIFSISLRGNQRQRLTSPPAGTFGDTHCAFAPDGKRLAVGRFPNISQSDLFVVTLNAASDHAIRRLTTGFLGIEGMDWSPNGRHIVLGSHVGLWMVDVDDSAQRPVRLDAASGSARHPSFARRPVVGSALRVAYGYELRDVNVWRWDVVTRRATPLAASTWWDDHPAVSPDGRNLAFASNRTGTTEIWVASSEGADPHQVTFHNGPVVTAPKWSPDGKWLAFSSEVAGNRDVYVIRPDGTNSNRLTTGITEERNPSWSRDGRTVYFRSDQGGVGRIWRMRRSGGSPVRVTSGEASEGVESPDGKWLYFVRNTHVAGLWSVPVDGGEETLVLPDVREGWWAVADSGIYFLKSGRAEGEGADSLGFYAFATQQVSMLPSPPKLRRAVQTGFSVPSRGGAVFWAQIDHVTRDLMSIDIERP